MIFKAGDITLLNNRKTSITVGVRHSESRSVIIRNSLSGLVWRLCTKRHPNRHIHDLLRDPSQFNPPNLSHPPISFPEARQGFAKLISWFQDSYGWQLRQVQSQVRIYANYSPLLIIYSIGCPGEFDFVLRLSPPFIFRNSDFDRAKTLRQHYSRRPQCAHSNLRRPCNICICIRFHRNSDIASQLYR